MGILAWLEREAHGKQIPLLILLFFLIYITYATVALWLLLSQGVNFEERGEGIDIPILTLSFPLVLLYLAFMEEIFFRFAPLFLAAALFRRFERGIILLFFVVASSVIFGWMHGGYEYIFFQGVFGVLFCVLYLKCGGMQGHHVKALVTTTGAHFLWNGTLAISMLTQGATYI